MKSRMCAMMGGGTQGVALGCHMAAPLGRYIGPATAGLSEEGGWPDELIVHILSSFRIL